MLDPERVEKFREMLLEACTSRSNLSFHDPDEVRLAVKSYQRHFNGKIIQVRGYDRAEDLGAPNTQGEHSDPVKFAHQILSKWRTGEKPGPDMTKDHQKLVEMLLRANSPFTAELKKRMAEGNLTPVDLRRQYDRIAILFLRSLLGKGPVLASLEMNNLDEDIVSLTQNTQPVRTYRRVSKTGKVGYVKAHPRTREVRDSGGRISKLNPVSVEKPPGASYVNKRSGFANPADARVSAVHSKELIDHAKLWENKLSEMDSSHLRKALFDAVKKRQSVNPSEREKLNIIVRLALLEMRKRISQHSNSSTK